MNEASGGSGPRSLWLTTRLGDVFNFDPEPLAKQQKSLAESLREQRLVPKSVESVKKDLDNMNINVNEALLKSEQEDGMIKASEENKGDKLFYKQFFFTLYFMFLLFSFCLTLFVARSILFLSHLIIVNFL